MGSDLKKVTVIIKGTDWILFEIKEEREELEILLILLLLGTRAGSSLLMMSVIIDFIKEYIGGSTLCNGRVGEKSWFRAHVCDSLF